MESNSRTPALEMNGTETEMVHQKKWAFNYSRNAEECQMTGLLLVVCSMTVRRLQTHDHQSWPSNVEPGDRRVLPSRVENEQRVQRLIVWAHSDILVQCHEQLWRPEDRACLYPTRSGTRSQWSQSCSRPHTGVSRPEWQTSRSAAFITRWNPFRARCKLLASRLLQ